MNAPKHSNSTAAQRERIADYLKTYVRATTIEMREVLDVLHPAGRVQELRERGWDIITAWEYHPTPCGKLHRVGVYVLLSTPKNAKA